MNALPLAHWIVSLMLFLHPGTPYQSTYENTAAAIDRVAHDSDLYPDDPQGVEETAAEIVAVASFESNFDPLAKNEDFGGDSIGLMQVNESNLPELRLTKAQLFDAETNIRAGVKLLRDSHRTCRGHRKLEQLAAYATGRGLCDVHDGVRASVNRMLLARRLLREHRPFWTNAADDDRVVLAWMPTMP